MRLAWRAAAGAVVVAVAAALGGVSPAVSQAEPAAAAKDFSKPAIVILGYGLAPDGSMRAILQRRVMTGLIVAQFFPQSTIIVTGGNPQNGKTEAGQMRNMLMLLGFPADRIILEDKANSTVQNAQFSVPLAKEAGGRQSAGDGELSRWEPERERRAVRARRDQSVRQRGVARTRAQRSFSNALSTRRRRRLRRTCRGR